MAIRKKITKSEQKQIDEYVNIIEDEIIPFLANLTHKYKMTGKSSKEINKIIAALEYALDMMFL